jgi:hypothetical protein
MRRRRVANKVASFAANAISLRSDGQGAKSSSSIWLSSLLDRIAFFGVPVFCSLFHSWGSVCHCTGGF